MRILYSFYQLPQDVQKYVQEIYILSRESRKIGGEAKSLFLLASCLKKQQVIRFIRSTECFKNVHKS